jgi:hypothetical protein
MKFLLTASLGLLVLLCVTCKDNRLKVNISNVRDEVSFVRYEQAFFSLGETPDSLQIAVLHSKYPEFTDLFSYRIIQMGSMTDSIGRSMVRAFLTDSVVRLSLGKAEKLFPRHPEFEKKLIRAFKYYRYYFPEKPFPVVYTCISGFNESVFISVPLIGISLDKYLGSDCPYYPMLGIQHYKQRKMVPERIPVDVVQAWGRSIFPISREATSLCDNMLYEGKLLYFTQALMPDLEDTLRTGFTAEQLEWCKKNESQMWNYLIENKLLFSTKQMDIVRYMNDGPTTNGFPPESPGRTGAWLGWQIIRAYAKRHPEVTIPQLMMNDNYLGILNSSAYAP